MGRIAAKGKAAFAIEEASMARDAAAGDGNALASLYERYEGRVYNLAFRITGSEADAADATQEAFLRTMRRLPELQDGEPAFGSSLLMATRNASRDLIEKRRPAQPSGPMPELGAGRRPSLDALQEEVRDANTRLPPHQRETLALLELEQLSYDEIAAIMGTNRNSIAQLIFRARINLRNELHGTVLATIAAPSRDCERALPLIAALEDEQLEAGSDDGAWLDGHLAGCERCRLGVEEMREAGAAYRAWEPIPVVPWLREKTMARGAALAGAGGSGASKRQDRPPLRRRAIVAAGLTALLLGGGIATVLAGSDPRPNSEERVADRHPARTAPASNPRSKRKEMRGPNKAQRAETASQPIAASSPATPAGESAPAAAPTGQRDAADLHPSEATATPKPKPKPAPTQQSPPDPEPQPSTEPPSEDPAQERPSKGRGPPPGVPSKGGPK